MNTMPPRFVAPSSPLTKTAVRFFFCLVLAAAGGGVFAQDAGLNIINYVKLFGFKGTPVEDYTDEDYVWEASTQELDKYGILAGTPEVDTPLEFALLSYYSKPVVSIRPKEAIDMLPANSKASEVKLAAATAMALAEARFLDGQNRGRIGRYEGMLQFIKDAAAKAGRPLADSDINAALAAAIGAAVDGEFGKISFTIRDTAANRTYNAVLTQDTTTRQYELRYERPSNKTLLI
jgi:hypothetical protein